MIFFHLVALYLVSDLRKEENEFNFKYYIVNQYEGNGVWD